MRKEGVGLVVQATPTSQKRDVGHPEFSSPTQAKRRLEWSTRVLTSCDESLREKGLQVGAIMVRLDRSEDVEGQGEGRASVLRGDDRRRAMADAIGKGFKF